MATSIRQQIMTAVDTRLKAMLFSNGYELDLGKSVHEWRSIPLDEGDLPAVVYRDRNEVLEITVGRHDHRMDLEIEIILSGAAAPTDLRRAIADVVKAVGSDRTWGGLAFDTGYGESESITVVQNERRVAGAILRFVVSYVTDPFDNYT